jgi:hypothetical protein
MFLKNYKVAVCLHGADKRNYNKKFKFNIIETFNYNIALLEYCLYVEIS